MSQPPPYGFSPPIAPTQIILPPALGPHSTAIVCPSCHKNISSRVEHEASTKTHLMAILLCILCCPCVILPYCMDSCQATNHYCPHCDAFLGTYDG